MVASIQGSAGVGVAAAAEGSDGTRLAKKAAPLARPAPRNVRRLTPDCSVALSLPIAASLEGSAMLHQPTHSSAPTLAESSPAEARRAKAELATPKRESEGGACHAEARERRRSLPRRSS